MRLLLHIKIFILLVITVSISAQEVFEPFDWFGRKQRVPGIVLPPLIANNDTTLARGLVAYTIVADSTPNTINGTREYFIMGQSEKIFLSGILIKIAIQVADVTKLTTLELGFWDNADSRDSSYNRLNKYTHTENLVPLLSNGANLIYLTQPIAIHDNSWMSIYIVGTGNGLAMYSGTNSRYYTALQTDTLHKAWQTGSTASSLGMPIQLYTSTSAVFLGVGNSVTAGTDNTADPYANKYFSVLSPSGYNNWDVKHSLTWTIGNYYNLSFTNMGVASISSSAVLSYFNSYAKYEKPKYMLIQGTENDKQIYNLPAITTYGNFRKMIDTCIIRDITPIVILSNPVTNYSNTSCRQMDTADAMIKDRCDSLGVKWFSPKLWKGIPRDTGDAGNLWNYGIPYTYDNNHDNMNGYRRDFREYDAYFRTLWSLPADTVRQYLVSVFSYLDTADRQDTSLKFSFWTSNYKGTDSVLVYTRINSEAEIRHVAVMDSSKAETDKWTYTLAIDTTEVTVGDTIKWRAIAYGYGTATIPSSNIIYINKPFYYTNRIAHWDAEHNFTASAWRSTIDTLTARNDTASLQPEVLGTLNGHNLIYFDGSDYMYFTGTGAMTDWTVVITYKRVGTGNGTVDYIMGGTGMGLFTVLQALATSWGAFDGSRLVDSAANAQDTNWNIRVFQKHNLYTNNVEVNPYLVQNTLLNFALSVIGGRYDPTLSHLPWKGYMAQIDVYNENVSTEHLTQIYQYYKAKYGL